MSLFDRSRSIWLARFVLPHEPALRRWLTKRRHLVLDVDDIVQESYAILSELGSVDHILNPRAYLFQTAHSVVLRELRKARIVSINVVDDIEELGIASNDPSPERQVSDREELQRLSDALRRFPAQCRAVFMLRKVEGDSQKEIAAKLGLAESTVEKHIARGVKLLMEYFSHGGSEPPHASNTVGKKSRYGRE